MKKKILLGILACLFFSVATHAQIGYQVALLNVANTLKSDFTLDELCKEWQLSVRKPDGYMRFNRDGSCSYRAYYGGNLAEDESFDGTFEVDGNNIYVYDGNDLKRWFRWRNATLAW